MNAPALPPVARFELLKELGSGGFGPVYQAWDRDASRLVALKLAHEARAAALRRFKSEFLTLCDASHEHVARLYELHHEAGAWFFTMEYVDGVPLDAWLLPELEGWPLATRPGRPVARVRRGAAPATDPTLAWATVPDVCTSAHASDEQPARVCPAVSEFAPGLPGAEARELGQGPQRFREAKDFERVRSAFRQVVEALAWLHATGHVHRDVKPSNVLVTPDGIVKLIDFGLVTRLRDGDEPPDPLAGTPPFMAPELVLGQRATPASDWYAVGVMLHLVLTGSLPWFARPDMSGASATYRPSATCEGIPEDLDALCGALLAADPADRPGALAILEALGAPPPRAAPPLRAEPPLRARLASHDVTALVLESRCLERGSLRFAALDGAVDDLAVMLAARMPRDVERLLPPDRATRAAMMALFPALQDCALDAEPALDLAPEALERAGLAGLAHVLGAIAAHRRVVIVVRDAQWVDADSARAIEALARVPIEWVMTRS
ncbi:MAG: serine/threonine protein kinase [Deltaproteobacteria bacterium]|nr:serine/threonine protein kinase [Deltaproteobacteria bacterium]